MDLISQNTKKNNEGFTLVECLIVLVLISLALAWSIPNLRRQLIRQSVNNYVLRIEAGLQALRMKQAVVKTGCEMNFPSDALTIVGPQSISKFRSPEDTIEVAKLTPTEKQNRLNCSDNPLINQGFRFLDSEQGRGTEDVELSFSRSEFIISPPGTSDDGGSLIILVRAKQHASLQPKLPIRCVEFSPNGLSRMGDWENGNCETR